MKFNRAKFYASFRPWFKKTHQTVLTQETVYGLNMILDYIENDPEWKDVRYVANFLAQTGHESMWRWIPIKEKRARTGTRVRRLQDKYWGTGFFGRGIIQLTHKRNYKIFEDILKLSLTTNPDLALEPRVSYLIAAIGMRKGLFTGYKLSDFIKPGKPADYKGCRMIVNGTDRDDDIAAYSVGIERALQVALEVSEETKKLVKDTVLIEYAPENDETGNSEASPALVRTDAKEQTPETLPSTDNYPESPKPGEGVPNEPARRGEPVTGGRTTDETVSVPGTEAKKPEGLKLWSTTILGWLTTLGISAGSIFSYLSGAIKDPTAGKIFLVLGAFSIAAAIIIGITYLIIRSMILIRREKMAHELNLKELEIRANPALYNVKIEFPKKGEPEKIIPLPNILGLKSKASRKPEAVAPSPSK